MAGRYDKTLILGLLIFALALPAAWAVRRQRSAALERPPVEALLQSLEERPAGSEPAVTAELTVKGELPLVHNARVEFWIDFLSGRNRERTQLWLERSGRYAPLILRELRSRGMPEDLFYLALIESGFSPRAYSRAHAAGIWQFIEETGRRYGLEVTSYVDERRDPLAATRAALDYLEKLHRQFGSWYLAAAAYNTGENRVERVLRQRAGGRRGADELFWKIDAYLPRETRDYVPLMLAARHVAQDPGRYGFGNVEYHAPLAFEAVAVPAATSLEAVARAIGVAADIVRDLNPHLVRAMAPPERGWSVRIPEGTSTLFAQSFPRMSRAERLASTTPAPSARAASYHRVRRGDSLWALARRYDVSVRQLQSWNRLGRTSRILPGQRLRVSA